MKIEHKLSEFISNNPRLFVITGAGCSTESGIPEYRDRQGQWKNRQPIQWQDFVRDHRVRQRFWARSLVGWRMVSQARPNPAHFALVALENKGFVELLVTQNVDGLHQAAGSNNVVELHGNIREVVCCSCQYRESRETTQQWLEQANPSFSQLSAVMGPDGDAELLLADFQEFKVPDCPDCGSILKPNAVFYGDNVKRSIVDTCWHHMESSDAILIVGSSMMVFSAYRYVKRAAEQCKPIAAINLGRTRADDIVDLKLEASCADVLPALVGSLQ